MSEPYIGEIRMFAGNFAPVNWLFCQGQLLAISDYDTLFVLIGTTYGGDGVQTFGLPDLASRIPIHVGPSNPVGSNGGVETVTLNNANLPPHSHLAGASTAAATATSPVGGVWAGWRDYQYSNAAPGPTMSAAALAPAGGSLPHDNMPPFVTLNFIISLFGIFPTPT